MNALVPTRRSWLTRPRVVGTPVHWASRTALFGGLLGWWAPTAFTVVSGMMMSGFPVLEMVVTFMPVNLASVGIGALLGGVLGLVQPALLDRMRGRVWLPVLVLAQAGVGATAGAVVAVAWFIRMLALFGPGGMPSFLYMASLMAGVGAGVGALATLLWWLPFTVATVLQRRTWPITAASVAASPFLLILMLLLAF